MSTRTLFIVFVAVLGVSLMALSAEAQMYSGNPFAGNPFQGPGHVVIVEGGHYPGPHGSGCWLPPPKPPVMGHGWGHPHHPGFGHPHHPGFGPKPPQGHWGPKPPHGPWGPKLGL